MSPLTTKLPVTSSTRKNKRKTWLQVVSSTPCNHRRETSTRNSHYTRGCFHEIFKQSDLTMARNGPRRSNRASPSEKCKSSTGDPLRHNGRKKLRSRWVMTANRQQGRGECWLRLLCILALDSPDPLCTEILGVLMAFIVPAEQPLQLRSGLFENFYLQYVEVTSGSIFQTITINRMSRNSTSFNNQTKLSNFILTRK